MAYPTSLINETTSIDPANLSREGNELLISPTIAFGTIAKNAWLRAGYFDPADDISPTTNTNTTDIKAGNPTGGPDITLLTETTEATAVFDSLAPLTPSKEVLAIHAGAPSVAVGSDGTTTSPFTIGASIVSRLILIKRRLSADPDRIQTVYWFPRAGLANNGTVQKQNRSVPNFRASILTWSGTVSDTDLAAAITDFPTMGQIIKVKNSNLNALITKLMAEAAAA